MKSFIFELGSWQAASICCIMWNPRNTNYYYFNDTPANLIPHQITNHLILFRTMINDGPKHFAVSKSCEIKYENFDACHPNDEKS